MLQAIGLTSTPRRNRPPAVDDLTFEALPGKVTALLGPRGSGKSAALRLMLGLERGRGVTYFRGRPLHRVAHPLREVGVLLGDLPGHPARTARGQLRMLCASAGVPVARADELLDVVGLAGLEDQRLGTLSLGMERRLGLAAALLGDPHTLLLDEPTAGLSPREATWLYGLLRAHAAHGGTVLCTTDDPKEAARTADRVVAVAAGRLVADQDATAFARTRLRPRVAVHTPHAARLAALIGREARAARRPVEVVTEAGNRLYVYGGDCAVVGETAFRHGILLHRLAEETGPAPDPAPHPQPLEPHAGSTATPPASTARPAPLSGPDTPAPGPAAPADHQPTPEPAPEPASDPAPESASAGQGPAAPTPDARATRRHPSSRPPRRARHRAWAGAGADAGASPGARTGAGPGPTPGPRQGAGAAAGKPRRGPSRPLQYELRRIAGVPSTPLLIVGTLAVSAVLAVLMARLGRAPLPTVLAAWPELLPLPPAALGAGLLGAFSYGHEYRYPVLQAALGAVPRRFGLLVAKLAVTAAAALLLAVAVAVVDLEALRLVYGGALIPVPANWPGLCATWAGLVVGCGWAGLLAAGVFRAAAAGLAAVLAVPVVIAPLVERTITVPAGRSIAGLPQRLRELALPRWPEEAERWLTGALHVLAQPVGAALALSLTTLLGAFLISGRLRSVQG
ncbi:ATP-binding cassette domain-containing protein [Streptomyces sp. TRM64462]|uniref:ABC transporter ATP-binding protein n=1 Tax=Streptomyces sp. TRM64462 TaxID=2741726 RepID=UPI001585DC36|nr:ATP-binding cassette domain-containing protein [Streptomyces sp. TRM64462]